MEMEEIKKKGKGAEEGREKTREGERAERNGRGGHKTDSRKVERGENAGENKAHFFR